MKETLFMIYKEKYDLINTKCERNYPGIHNYNLRYVADEIVHTIYKELLENTYFLSITDIQQDYQLTKPETLKVLEMISKEPDISSKGFVKQDTVELKIKNSVSYDEVNQLLCDKHPDLYNDAENSLSFFGRSWLPGLVYSLAQAQKIAMDLINLVFKEKNSDTQSKELLNKYVQDRMDLTMEESIQDDGTTLLTLKSDGTPLLKGSAFDLIKTLGLSERELLSRDFQSISDKDISAAILHYYEYIQKEQMEGIIDNQMDLFISDHELDKDILDDYFDKDDAINEIWKKRAEIDPFLPHRNKLNENDMAWISLEVDDQLDIAYQFALEQEKVMSYGS